MRPLPCRGNNPATEYWSAAVVASDMNKDKRKNSFLMLLGVLGK
jgi:hypothetical protein